MNLDHYYLLLALFEKQIRGKDVALLIVNGQVEAIGEAGATKQDSAIVNLLHNKEGDKPSIYCSYIPTEMCQGLAWQARVGRLVFLRGDAAREIKPKDDLGDVENNLGTQTPTALIIKVASANPVADKTRLDTFPTTADARSQWLKLFNNHNVTLTKPAQQTYESIDACTNVYRERVTDGKEKTTLTAIASCIPVQSGSCVTSQLNKDRLWMKVTYALAGATLPDQRSALNGGHNVAALMISDQDRILGWGVNINQLKGSYHAETSMVLAYLRKHNVQALPAGVKIYSTLAPCHMCAGLLTHLSQNLAVVVGHLDPRITHSALDRNHNESSQRQTTMLPIFKPPVVAAQNGAVKQQFVHALWMKNFEARNSTPGNIKVASSADWLDAIHKGHAPKQGVTTFLNGNASPKALFTYNYSTLKELRDSKVGDAGENIILERGVALLDLIKTKGFIK